MPPTLIAFGLGCSLGFANGISPGPTLALTITQTLQRGWRAGTLVALAPLFTDVPIILLALLVVGNLPPGALAWLGVAGGLVVIWFGVETLRTARSAAREAGGESQATGARAALWRGIVTNALNPHPYVFWASAGASLLASFTRESGLAGAACFLAGFYALLTGVKLAVALLVHRSRGWLHGRVYRALLVTGGVVRAGLGVLLIVESALPN